MARNRPLGNGYLFGEYRVPEGYKKPSSVGWEMAQRRAQRRVDEFTKPSMKAETVTKFRKQTEASWKRDATSRDKWLKRKYGIDFNSLHGGKRIRAAKAWQQHKASSGRSGG